MHPMCKERSIRPSLCPSPLSFALVSLHLAFFAVFFGSFCLFGSYICDAHWCVRFVCWRGIDACWRLLLFCVVPFWQLFAEKFYWLRFDVDECSSARVRYVQRATGTKMHQRNASAGFPATQYATFSQKVLLFDGTKRQFSLCCWLGQNKQANLHKNRGTCMHLQREQLICLFSFLVYAHQLLLLCTSSLHVSILSFPSSLSR